MGQTVLAHHLSQKTTISFLSLPFQFLSLLLKRIIKYVLLSF